MQEATERPHWKRTLAILGVMAASFAFQETGVLPVLSTIQRQLPGASTTSSALLESGFLIVAAVAAPWIGKYGDAHGKQRMLLVTLAIYLVGALGAGLAPNFIVLVVFRALQGAGGALFSLSFDPTGGRRHRRAGRGGDPEVATRRRPRAPLESAFTIAFGVCALLAAIGAVLALSVPANVRA